MHKERTIHALRYPRYHEEGAVESWTKEEDASLMTELHEVHDRLESMGMRLAHVGRVSEGFARQLAVSPMVDRVLHPTATILSSQRVLGA